MLNKIVLCCVSMLFISSPLLAEELKIGAGAAPTENVLKPSKSAFEKATGINLTILASGPKQAFIDLDRGSVDAAAAGLSMDDWLALLKKEGVTISDPTTYQAVVIGKDRVIVIVHKDNPVTKLSKEQLTDIFSGKINNWKDVGGKDAPILVVWGGLTQGTNSMFVKHIMAGAKPTTDVITATTAEDIRQNIAANPEAIGIGPQAIVNATVRSPETPEVARPITLITKGAPSPKVKKLLDFLQARK
ncbi:phosphate-binding protein PstS [Geobacter sp. OR-1]|uniref:substrate-binding domain-containing protein n=1 Tax=Geobacter sp. OR-1 TaxID=1266765 RepID=UPI000542504F|nr:substrate-binding domain-containing protein [Geobacter sp. OR-1]GAM08649.1 phosphate-binding protein PstS [Geobacter sp. OR-1]